jgi:eukaryotic translation initiation factor 2C
MVYERIKDWYNANNARLPAKILYYRDGVDEGQYTKIQTMELPKICDALTDFAEKELNMASEQALDLGAKLKITALVVAKRHHVRFFTQNRDLKDYTGNCKPGLVVDGTVTSPYLTDYYLQSHCGLQGTAKPTHYFLLQHELGMSVDELAKLTHELCYTYVRATIGVSYAPPEYYADRLCDRGRCYLRKYFVPDPDFAKRLDNYKGGLEHDLLMQRQKKWPPRQRAVDGNRKRVKSVEELEQETGDKETVERTVNPSVMEKAKADLYRHSCGPNPWNEDVGKVMFWM